MTLIRCGVVTDLVASGRPKTSKELAESTGASEKLIVRLMRPLTPIGVFREEAEYTYAATPISQALVTPALLGGYQFMFHYASSSLANMPGYLERTGFKHVDGAPGPFQDSRGTDELMWPYVAAKDPVMMANFNHFMAGSLAARTDWFQKFDAESIALAGAETNDPEATLLVDIGGGKGHDVEAFLKAFPDAPGKLVLQDLPPVIEDIEQLDDRIIRQGHDMFSEQLVRGARAYYMRNIYHDWPDHSCVQIMKRIAEAMTRGYSKLLIFEWILPAKGVPLYPALLDMNMMALLNGRERTEEDWSELLNAAGLKIVQIHRVSVHEESLIEAELA